ncbi:LysR family transcriptional regulator [Novimethylophilus kurashikiensis]|uniref:LysR family transcriptional regulator n=1 Tax=Novimethylophilus kurashikiensis TaxID=1825523 RepID=A0A2R5F8H3_9PROT|nr:LysR family transcriptional regulator [Novimethylophilus kurashikiensis]
MVSFFVGLGLITSEKCSNLEHFFRLSHRLELLEGNDLW